MKKKSLIYSDLSKKQLENIFIAKGDLNSKKTKIKGEILMAIGHSFLYQGYTKQAASYYGTFIQEFPKSSRLPQALYYLGKAFEKLGQKNKKEVLWNDLILKFPNSNFSKRAKKMMLKTKESKK